ncbi:sensor histidine kinase, partial [Streptomyces sp. PSRA5]|uniref:sensor histidine kinase n=1 Tax=Streptomyces panacea TaxID=3035064 RepID=UPI00339D253B
MNPQSWGRAGAPPRRVDLMVVLGLLAFSIGGSVFTGLVFDTRAGIWPAVLLSVIGCAALYWRRSLPRTVVAVTALCAVVESSLGYLLTPLLQGPLIAALYSLGLLTDRRNTRVCALLTAALMVVTGLFADPGRHDPLLTTVNPIAWVLLPAVLGSAVQLRRAYFAAVHARADHAERTREEEARHRVAQERMRIARELHDVVAHHLALANAQAGTAAHLVRAHSDQAGAMLDSLRETTASALREMKATVGLLRQDNESESLGPAPGLAQLGELTAAFATAGLVVRTEVEGEPRPLPAGVDLSAYRIVQEALTNVTKHAATATADVRLAYFPDHVTLTVSNDDDDADVAPFASAFASAPASASAPDPGHGFGLVGMRERAHSAGGTLHAGPRPAGGFEITCTLP